MSNKIHKCRSYNWFNLLSNALYRNKTASVINGSSFSAGYILLTSTKFNFLILSPILLFEILLENLPDYHKLMDGQISPLRVNFQRCSILFMEVGGFFEKVA